MASQGGGRKASKPSARSQLLAIITVILTAWALRVSTPVTLPLAFALFLVALFWPLQHRLERRMSRAPAVGLTILCFFLSISLFSLALWHCGMEIKALLPRYEDRLGALWGHLTHWTHIESVSDVAKGVYNTLLYFTDGLFLVVAYFILALLEVPDFRAKLAKGFGEERAAHGSAVLHRISHDFQRYVTIRTGIGLVTAVGVGGISVLLGLDLAFVWGLISFLLNYIPSVGSAIAVIPPTLFAYVQFHSVSMTFLTLGAVGSFQLVLGAYFDPLWQGRYLSLSPLTVIVSISLWGWIWGVAGAFISIPLTVALVIACHQFPKTRWIAVLLADMRHEKE